jgi:uncharacterized protein YfbU (UPF0304 family)
MNSICTLIKQELSVREEKFMAESITIFENELVQKFRMLSEEKQQEVLDFVSFLLSKVQKSQQQADETEAVSAVEETWGNLSLDRETLMYIAEDKELEYDV